MVELPTAYDMHEQKQTCRNVCHDDPELSQKHTRNREKYLTRLFNLFSGFFVLIGRKSLLDYSLSPRTERSSYFFRLHYGATDKNFIQFSRLLS